MSTQPPSGATPAKRTTRVTFNGVSSLPKEKALALGGSLQAIINKIIVVFGQLDDPKINVERRLERVSELRDLMNDVETLEALARDQVTMCTDPEIKPVVQQKYEIIVNAHIDLKAAWRQLMNDNADNSERAAAAKVVFDSLMLVLNNTIELLKQSDKNTISKMVGMTNASLVAVKRLREAVDGVTLLEAAQEVSTANVSLASRMQRREKVITDDALRGRLLAACAQLKDGTAPAIVATRAALESSGAADAQEHKEAAIQTLLDAIRDIVEVIRVSPEFSVNFEVEYAQDSLSIDMVDIQSAVQNADVGEFTAAARRAVEEVANQVRQGQSVAPTYPDPQKSLILDACRDANAAIKNLIQSSRDALKAKEDNNNQDYFDAEKKMVAAIKVLKEVTPQIPVKKSQRMAMQKSNLLEAARNLCDNMNGLLAGLQLDDLGIPGL